MPMENRVLDGGRGQLVRSRGDVSEHEYLSVMRKHLADIGRRPECVYSLADFSHAGRTDIGPEAVRTVAELSLATAVQRPDLLLAAVGGRDLVYGLVRMFQAYASGLPWEMEAFRSLAEAEDWLRERARERFGVDGLEFS